MEEEIESAKARESKPHEYTTRHRQTDRPQPRRRTDRPTCMQTERQTQPRKQAGRQTGRQTGKQTDKETSADIETDQPTNQTTNRRTDRPFVVVVAVEPGGLLLSVPFQLRVVQPLLVPPRPLVSPERGIGACARGERPQRPLRTRHRKVECSERASAYEIGLGLAEAGLQLR
eukprot:945876-Rhodomonas_salina.3